MGLSRTPEERTKPVHSIRLTQVVRAFFVATARILLTNCNQRLAGHFLIEAVLANSHSPVLADSSLGRPLPELVPHRTGLRAVMPCSAHAQANSGHSFPLGPRLAET